MSKIHEFIDKAGVFFLATEDVVQTKVRPLGAHIEEERNCRKSRAASEGKR